ncbi:MAG: replicative DNA helicase, partial [Spirochaetaceae bacterium]|nr:replicative DNA helicase [Spirochaetaceae bacterium]
TVTLVNYLKNNNLLEKAEGVAYIATLVDNAPSSAYLKQYAEIIAELALRRRLINIAGKIDSSARDEGKKIDEILEDIDKALYGLNRKLNDYKPSSELVKATINTLEERKNSKALYTGIPSRFTRLDDMLSGLQNAEMIVIGARPSMGKTAFALSILDNIVTRQNDEVIAAGFFSLEMNGELLVQRLIASRARIDGNRLKRPNLLSTKDWAAMDDTASLLYEAPIFFEDTPNISLNNLRSQARRMKAKENIKILFIDYLGLITVEERTLPRHEQMSLVSRSIKGLARELNIPIVVMAQLRRDAEGNEPGLADIRDSGSIEQDADVVMFLHRQRPKGDEESSSEELLETQLIVAKNRNGPVGTIRLAFTPRFVRFDNLERD